MSVSPTNWGRRPDDRTSRPDTSASRRVNTHTLVLLASFNARLSRKILKTSPQQGVLCIRARILGPGGLSHRPRYRYLLQLFEWSDKLLYSVGDPAI